MAKKASSSDQLAASLRDWKSDLTDDARITSAIMEPAVMADLAGQLFVKNIEVGQKKKLLANAIRPAFLNLPYAEALEFWKAQGGSPQMLDRVLRHYRSQNREVSSLLLDEVSRRVMDRVQAVISDGGTLPDFVSLVQNDQANLGITPANSSYLQTVFRTNVQTAYGAGRFRQITDPEVIEVRPFVQYRTAEDNRVRATHAVLNGLIFDARSSDWHRIAPPNGYNCRCSVVSLDEDDVAQEVAAGNRVATSIPDTYEADEGFDQPPTASLE